MTLTSSNQWDALRHIRAREFGWYNGFGEHDTGKDGNKLGIDKYAQRGFVWCRLPSQCDCDGLK